jgi:hypothetical protein
MHAADGGRISKFRPSESSVTPSASTMLQVGGAAELLRGIDARPSWGLWPMAGRQAGPQLAVECARVRAGITSGYRGSVVPTISSDGMNWKDATGTAV